MVANPFPMEFIIPPVVGTCVIFSFLYQERKEISQRLTSDVSGRNSKKMTSCKYPGCLRACFVETSGKVHDFCGRTHAQAYQTLMNGGNQSPVINTQTPHQVYSMNNGSPIATNNPKFTSEKTCKFPGCTKLANENISTGQKYDFCSKYHALEYGKLCQEGDIGVTMQTCLLPGCDNVSSAQYCCLQHKKQHEGYCKYPCCTNKRKTFDYCGEFHQKSMIPYFEVLEGEELDNVINYFNEKRHLDPVDNFQPKNIKVFKIFPPAKLSKMFSHYQNWAESQGVQNSVLLFHGTSVQCSLANTPCCSSDCGFCSILHGNCLSKHCQTLGTFDVGEGLYFSKHPSQADTRSKGMKRAVILTQVVAGNSLSLETVHKISAYQRIIIQL